MFPNIKCVPCGIFVSNLASPVLLFLCKSAMLFWSKSLHQDRRTVKLSHYNTYKMYDIGVRVHFNALAWVRLSAIRRIGGWLRCRPRLPLLDTDGTLGYNLLPLNTSSSSSSSVLSSSMVSSYSRHRIDKKLLIRKLFGDELPRLFPKTLMRMIRRCSGSWRKRRGWAEGAT